MSMTPALRRFLLTLHIIVSVGWLGAVAAFLALSLAGLASPDAQPVHSVYPAMNLISLYVIVPSSLAAVATGLVQALGSPWGLRRYYWVLLKLVLGVLATAALLMHQCTAVAEAARLASGADAGSAPDERLRQVGIQLVADAGFALMLLVTTATLAVYKPWGPTRYGWRKQRERRRALGQSGGEAATPGAPGPNTGLRVFLAAVGVLALGFIVLHLIGRGLGGHGF